jgi:hypothetical protein
VQAVRYAELVVSDDEPAVVADVVFAEPLVSLDAELPCVEGACAGADGFDGVCERGFGVGDAAGQAFDLFQ